MHADAHGAASVVVRLELEPVFLSLEFVAAIRLFSWVTYFSNFFVRELI